MPAVIEGNSNSNDIRQVYTFPLLFDLPIDCDIFLDRYLLISYSWLSVLSHDHVILSFFCLYCYIDIITDFISWSSPCKSLLHLVTVHAYVQLKITWLLLVCDRLIYWHWNLNWSRLWFMIWIIRGKWIIVEQILW